jgi:hypothetical protein
MIGPALDLHLNIITSTLAGSLASGNASIRNMARDTFRGLATYTDLACLIVPLTQVTQSTNIRAKPVLIQIIDEVTDAMYS